MDNLTAVHHKLFAVLFRSAHLEEANDAAVFVMESIEKEKPRSSVTSACGAPSALSHSGILFEGHLQRVFVSTPSVRQRREGKR